jgi:hypothetical protein
VVGRFSTFACINWLTPVTTIKLSIKLGQVVFSPQKRFSIITPEDKNSTKTNNGARTSSCIPYRMIE